MTSIFCGSEESFCFTFAFFAAALSMAAALALLLVATLANAGPIQSMPTDASRANTTTATTTTTTIAQSNDSRNHSSCAVSTNNTSCTAALLNASRRITNLTAALRGEESALLAATATLQATRAEMTEAQKQLSERLGRECAARVKAVSDVALQAQQQALEANRVPAVTSLTVSVFGECSPMKSVIDGVAKIWPGVLNPMWPIDSPAWDALGGGRCPFPDEKRRTRRLWNKGNLQWVGGVIAKQGMTMSVVGPLSKLPPLTEGLLALVLDAPNTPLRLRLQIPTVAGLPGIGTAASSLEYFRIYDTGHTRSDGYTPLGATLYSTERTEGERWRTPPSSSWIYLRPPGATFILRSRCFRGPRWFQPPAAAAEDGGEEVGDIAGVPSLTRLVLRIELEDASTGERRKPLEMHLAHFCNRTFPWSHADPGLVGTLTFAAVTLVALAMLLLFGCSNPAIKRAWIARIIGAWACALGVAGLVGTAVLSFNGETYGNGDDIGHIGEAAPIVVYAVLIVFIEWNGPPPRPKVGQTAAAAAAAATPTTSCFRAALCCLPRALLALLSRAHDPTEPGAAEALLLLVIGLLGHIHIFTVLGGDRSNHELFHALMPFYVTQMGILAAAVVMHSSPSSARSPSSASCPPLPPTSLIATAEVTSTTIQQESLPAVEGKAVDAATTIGGRGGGKLSTARLSGGSSRANIAQHLRYPTLASSSQPTDDARRWAAVMAVPCSLLVSSTFFLLHQQGEHFQYQVG